MPRDPFLRGVRKHAQSPQDLIVAITKALAADDTLYAQIARYADLDDQHMVNILVKDALKAMDDDDEPVVGDDEEERYSKGSDTYGPDGLRRARKVEDPTGMLTSGTGLPRAPRDEDDTKHKSIGGRLDGLPFATRKSRHGGRLDGKRLD
jgi:hypothetical protein